MKKYIAAYQSVKEKENILFGSIIDVLTDFHANGSYESIAKVFALLDTKNYAYMVRTTDLEKKDYESDVKYITQDCYNYLSKSQLYGGELLINKIGNPGESYIMPKLDYPSSLGMNLFMIRIKKDSDYNTKFIWAYLNTNIGRHIINRKINGTVPLTIDKEAIRSLYIPVFSKQFMTAIAHIIDKSELILSRSKQVYKNSEELIYKALHLDTWEPATETKSIKSYSDCFINCNRLDAEYYQPKYDELINLVKSHQPGYGKLEMLFLIKDRNYIPVDGCLYKYIELSNIGSDGSITGHTEALGEDLPNRARRIVRSGDLIVSSLEGSLNSCAIIPEKYDGAICSTGFYVLTPKDINVETALVLFKSQLMQALMTRVCSGSIMAGMNTDEFANLIVPKIDQHTQHVIAEIIQDCAQKREESIRLLELAKTAVEIAIEQGEDKAMELLCSN